MNPFRPLYRHARGNRTLSWCISRLKYLIGRHHKFEPLFPKWLTDRELESPSLLRYLRKDILLSALCYGVSPEEYLRYQFWKRSHLARLEYVPERESTPLQKSISDPESRKILVEKPRTYDFFREFYRRDAVEILDGTSLPAFRAFCAKHPQFIIKPCKRFGGEGVRKIDIAGRDVDALFREISSNGRCLAEEIVKQSPEMGKFHPQSVNTIRTVTCWTDGELRVIQASVRMGTGESIVDNGCLSAAIDVETGIITSPGRSAHGRGLYLLHPDTHETILGSQIPHWKECLEFSVKLSSKLPKQKVIGWDLCLAQDGWLVIEGNCCPAIQILAGDGVGARDILNIMKKK